MLTLPTQQPTQQELMALRTAAEAADKEGQHVYTHPRDSNNWRANYAWHCVASPKTFLDMAALIDAQQKKIAEQDAQLQAAYP